MSPAVGLDLGTFFVQQVVIHRVPKARIGQKADSRPWLSEMPSVLTNDLKLYFRNRITSSLNTQRFKVVYTPLPAPAPAEQGAAGTPAVAVSRRAARPSPIPQLILDYFGSDRDGLVPISQKMAQYLYDMQGGSSSEGLLVVVDAVIGSGTNTGACLVLLKLEDDPALSVTEVETPEGRTMQVELHNVTLPQKAKVFKVALFPRVDSLGALRADVSDHQRDERAYGSEVAEFFLRYLGCQLRDTADRATKTYVEALEEFIGTIGDDEKKARYLLAGLADIQSQSTVIDPKAFAELHLEPGDADAFKQRLALPDGSIPTITKDTSLVASKVKNVMAEFSGGIKVMGPRAALEESLRKQNGQWVIDATLEHIGPTGRR